MVTNLRFIIAWQKSALFCKKVLFTVVLFIMHNCEHASEKISFYNSPYLKFLKEEILFYN